MRREEVLNDIPAANRPLAFLKAIRAACSVAKGESR
jgi:hypothetical protein